MRVVVEDHSVSVELLNRLQTFGVAVTEFLIISVFGDCGELEDLNLLAAAIFLFENFVSDVEVESNEVTCVKFLRLSVVGNVD